MKQLFNGAINGRKACIYGYRCYSQNVKPVKLDNVINGVSYKCDSWTNVTPKIINHVGLNLHSKNHHPLKLLKDRIVSFFNMKFRKWNNPLFAVIDNLPPIVTVKHCFDDLLIPVDHPSRKKSDCYYLNANHLMRTHTSAHQVELISMGFDGFLMVGDVYRRDEIDKNHYPVFHQMEGVRLFDKCELFGNPLNADEFSLFDNGNKRNAHHQDGISVEAHKLLEANLKKTLVSLAKDVFGPNVEHRWVETYFPFTHPSWELEIELNGNWTEILGCGVIEQDILKKAGVIDKVGWAFGLGLERMAMKVYSIPDIRIFHSTDKGFLCQFEGKTPFSKIKYKEISKFPPCSNDISFFVNSDSDFCPNDFYDLVRDMTGEMVEQVNLVDSFFHPKHQKQSYCYRITYRHCEKTLLQEEVNKMHEAIGSKCEQIFKVTIRK